MMPINQGNITKQDKVSGKDCEQWIVLEGERLNLRTFGYPDEMPLHEAIKLFNEEKQCKPLLESYPALTEDELIAAIVGGADDGKQGDVWLAQKDVLWKIASSRMMPKGSLLIARSGSRESGTPLRPNDTIAARGITIVLLLGLDDSVDGILKPRRPEQTFIIRKTYYKYDIVN